MASYTTQATITPEQLAGSVAPDELIKSTEESVRATLEGSPHERDDADEPAGETVIAWLARSPGTGPGAAPSTQRPTTYVPWDPADDVPDDADLLSCRGRRTA
jgi:hypothetical protein